MAAQFPPQLSFSTSNSPFSQPSNNDTSTDIKPVIPAAHLSSLIEMGFNEKHIDKAYRALDLLTLPSLEVSSLLLSLAVVSSFHFSL